MEKKNSFFNILAQNIHCRYTLEPPRRGGSNANPRCMFWIKNKKIRYTPENASFPHKKKWSPRGYILNGHVFLMRQEKEPIHINLNAKVPQRL